MEPNDTTPPRGQQQAPLSNSPRIDKLEDRVRAIEDKLNKADGVLAVLRLLGPPVLIVVGGIVAVVIAFFLGQSSAD